MRISWSFAIVLSAAIAAPLAAQKPAHREARAIAVVCADGTHSIVSGRDACTGHGGVRRPRHVDRASRHIGPSSRKVAHAMKPQAKHAVKPYPKRPVKPQAKHAAQAHGARRVGLREAKPTESQIRIARDGNPTPCNAKSASTPASPAACADRTAAGDSAQH